MRLLYMRWAPLGLTWFFLAVIRKCGCHYLFWVQDSQLQKSVSKLFVYSTLWNADVWRRTRVQTMSFSHLWSTLSYYLAHYRSWNTQRHFSLHAEVPVFPFTFYVEFSCPAADLDCVTGSCSSGVYSDLGRTGSSSLVDTFPLQPAMLRGGI